MTTEQPSAIEIAVKDKLAEWVKTDPEVKLVDVFYDDHIAGAEFTINDSDCTYSAFWIGSENVGAFKYASHCDEAFNDMVGIIRDKLLSGPFDVDDQEYRIAIAIGFTYAEMLDLDMLDI